MTTASHYRQQNRAWRKWAEDMMDKQTTSPAPEDLPDYDELIDLYNNLRNLVQELKAQNAALRDENYQLRRRNAKSTHRTPDRLNFLEAENERLRGELAAAQRKLSTTGWHGKTHNNRPVISPKQAAKQTGCHLATCYRYCESGWWQAARLDGHWLIYADQSLKLKRGSKK
ncbi:MAG: hypothetical protein D6712_03685 [Chloroflexi bacterium]|nr:MAG: hypothetical protein D6712_03685 [Chloroflexota bacterium]